MKRLLRTLLPILGACLAFAVDALGQAAPKPDSRIPGDIDRAVKEVMAATGVPSASIAVVKDGRLAYAQAYGDARVDPRTPARPDMRYSIGSVSKQFTATAVLMLAEQGKLSLDDPVSRFLPELTRAGEVTIRQLLSHTSGYQDYWPQDFVPPFMLQPITATGILARWAGKPLDFEPGTQYQYSNTAYVAAGLVVEKASGTPLMQFLAARIFAPLGMMDVANVDEAGLPSTDPAGYLRYGLGPLRVAPKEGRGWLFAAGELAMTSEDLARWNVGMFDQRLLKPASYREMQTEVLLKNGLGTGYGLGIRVGTKDGHRVLVHDGAVSGFTASNMVFPDDRAAVSVLLNLDSSDAESIADRIATLLFENRVSAAAGEQRAGRIFEGLQRGKIDRALFTENANAYFTEQALSDFASGLLPLGPPQRVEQTRWNDRGGMTFRRFAVNCSSKRAVILERDMPDGKIEQYQVMPAD